MDYMDYIVKVTYRVEGTIFDTLKEAEQCEAGRWAMLQQKYEMKPLDLKVELIKREGIN